MGAYIFLALVGTGYLHFGETRWARGFGFVACGFATIGLILNAITLIVVGHV